MPALSPSPSPSPPPGLGTDKEIATSVAEHCADLRRLARRPRSRTVAYRLDMARLDAEKTAERLPG